MGIVRLAVWLSFLPGIILVMVAAELTCKNTVEGVDYSGTLNHTQSGFTCQRWDSQEPNQHNNDRFYEFVDLNASKAENYCRNPSNEIGGPWCYTTDGPRWEICDVPYCTTYKVECKKSRLGKEYTGVLNITDYGNICQRWDTNTPRYNSYQDINRYPPGTGNLSNAENYCRNPDSSSKGPWCYSLAWSWEYCNLPYCTEISLWNQPHQAIDLITDAKPNTCQMLTWHSALDFKFTIAFVNPWSAVRVKMYYLGSPACKAMMTYIDPHFRGSCRNDTLTLCQYSQVDSDRDQLGQKLCNFVCQCVTPPCNAVTLRFFSIWSGHEICDIVVSSEE